MKILRILLIIFFQLIVVVGAYSENSSSTSKKEEKACKVLYTAVENGQIDIVKKLTEEESQLICIKYALKQKFPSGKNEQFKAFRYLVEKLIIMKPEEKISTLNEILQSYAIVYLSDDPIFTEYLLSKGALPVKPDTLTGWFPIISALWAVNDLGDCKTPHLLLDASSPEVLGFQNDKGETALMQSVDKGYPCPKELKLLAQKSAGIDFIDQFGNTALHYLLMKIKRDTDANRPANETDLAILHILLKRKASINLPNKYGITASQLLVYLNSLGFNYSIE